MDLPLGCFLVAYYDIYVLLLLSMGESRYFLFERYRLTLLVSSDRQAVLCLVLFSLFRNCFPPFTQYHYFNFW